MTTGTGPASGMITGDPPACRAVLMPIAGTDPASGMVTGDPPACRAVLLPIVRLGALG